MIDSLDGFAWVRASLGWDQGNKVSKPIHLASKVGDIFEVKRILSNSEPFSFTSFLNIFQREAVNLNALDHLGYSPLHYAALEGHLEVVKALLAYDANIDVLDPNGYSPLFLAIHSGNLEVASFLIEKGAAKFKLGDLNANRLLLLAARFGHLDKLALALQCGSQINFVDSTGNSALSYVLTLRGRSDMVKLLLENGHPLQLAVPDHASALHMAVMRGELESARLLFQATPYRPADLVAPPGHTQMMELLASPPPFKVRSLKTLCWLEVRRNPKLEVEAKAMRISE